jgi:hypothetical protein
LNCWYCRIAGESAAAVAASDDEVADEGVDDDDGADDGGALTDLFTVGGVSDLSDSVEIGVVTGEAAR